MVVFIIALFFILPILLYKKLYFKPITALVLSSDGSDPDVVTLKPGKRFFTSFGCGERVGRVHLGNKIYAYYVDHRDGAALKFHGMRFYGHVYLVQAGFLGRLKSINIADRSVISVVQNFN